MCWAHCGKVSCAWDDFSTHNLGFSHCQQRHREVYENRGHIFCWGVWTGNTSLNLVVLSTPSQHLPLLEQSFIITIKLTMQKHTALAGKNKSLAPSLSSSCCNKEWGREQRQKGNKGKKPMKQNKQTNPQKTPSTPPKHTKKRRKKPKPTNLKTTNKQTHQKNPTKQKPQKNPNPNIYDLKWRWTRHTQHLLKISYCCWLQINGINISSLIQAMRGGLQTWQIKALKWDL